MHLLFVSLIDRGCRVPSVHRHCARPTDAFGILATRLYALPCSFAACSNSFFGQYQPVHPPRGLHKAGCMRTAWRAQRVAFRARCARCITSMARCTAQAQRVQDVRCASARRSPSDGCPPRRLIPDLSRLSDYDGNGPCVQRYPVAHFFISLFLLYVGDLCSALSCTARRNACQAPAVLHWSRLGDWDKRMTSGVPFGVQRSR